MITLAACSAAAAGVIGAWHAARTSGFSSAEEAAVAALMAAARAGRVSELTETIEGGGVHVDARGEDGRTALAVCAAEGHAAAVRLLLSLGADHKAAVHHAAAAGHTAALHLLLVASSGEAAFTLRDADGMLPLHAAAAHARLAAIEALLSLGAPADALTTNRHRRTPLMLAAACHGNEQAPACVRVLLDNNIDGHAALADAAGNTALHLACADGGDPAIAQVLLDEGAPIFALNQRGLAPLDLCAPGSPLRALLDAAAAVRLRNGSAEANAAQAAKATLVRRMREMAQTDPSLLESLCTHDEATRTLLSRFGLRAPGEAEPRTEAVVAPEAADAMTPHSAPAAEPPPTARVTNELRGMLDSMQPSRLYES